MNVEKELKPIAQKQYDNSMKWIEESSQSIANEIKQKYYESKKDIMELF